MFSILNRWILDGGGRTHVQYTEQVDFGRKELAVGVQISRPDVRVGPHSFSIARKALVSS